MLFSIMIGVVVITFFIADIVNQSTIQNINTEHAQEISSINKKNVNFTSHFLKSSVVLDQAREYRAFGNYHFDLANLWYESALSENNATRMQLYKSRSLNNCTLALDKYNDAYDSFDAAMGYFSDTKSYTDYDKYLYILDLYINLTNTGAKLSKLRTEAVMYISFLSENLTYDAENNIVVYEQNVTEILSNLTITMGAIGAAEKEYDDNQEIIDEYPFFDEIR